ncbi:MAG: hypothetical protein LLF82_000769 [Dehalococcoides mccartyi]|nr:hypothetical protein [Dehalococcoides mccartyi]
MLKILQSILQLVLLVFALNILFAHTQAAWYESSTMGLVGAIQNEWAKAWQTMLVAVFIVIACFILQWRIEKQDAKKAMAEKEERYKSHMEIMDKLDSMHEDIKALILEFRVERLSSEVHSGKEEIGHTNEEKRERDN